MTERTLSREVWIGLVGVRPRLGNDLLGDAKGAWVNFLAPAVDVRQYRAEVSEALAYYSLDLIGIEDAEPLRQRLARTVIDPELQRLAREVEDLGQPRFGTFHVFSHDESEPPPH